MKSSLKSHPVNGHKDTAGRSARTFSNAGNGCSGEVRGCASPSPILSKVVEIVAAEAGLTPSELLDRTRIQRTAWPRNVAYWCAFKVLGNDDVNRIVFGRRLPAMSQVDIARYFRRDRSAISYGASTVEAMAATRPEVKRAVEAVLEKIQKSLEVKS